MELLIDTATTNARLCDGSCRTEVSAQMILRPIGRAPARLFHHCGTCAVRFGASGTLRDNTHTAPRHSVGLLRPADCPPRYYDQHAVDDAI